MGCISSRPPRVEGETQSLACSTKEIYCAPPERDREAETCDDEELSEASSGVSSDEELIADIDLSSPHMVSPPTCVGSHELTAETKVAEASMTEEETEQYRKGHQFIEEGEFLLAVDWYTQVLETLSSSAEETRAAFLMDRSNAFTCLGDHASALKDTERCCALRPKWSTGYFRKGEVLEGLGRFPEAADAYAKALKYDPNNSEIQERIFDLLPW